MLSEVLKELPTSDYVKPKRRVRTTSPAVKKAYKKGYLNKNQETFTREECEAMIEFAINQHNRNAGQISMVLGFIFMALFADGLKSHLSQNFFFQFIHNLLHNTYINT